MPRRPAGSSCPEGTDPQRRATSTALLATASAIAARRDRERFFARPRRALYLGTALLGVVALLALLVPSEPFALDRAWSDAMQDIQTPLLKRVALVFDALGHGFGLALTLAAIGIVLSLARRWFALLTFTVAEGVSNLVSLILKALIGRARPPDGVVHPLTSSFPSGHATYAGATCIALVLLFTAPGRHRRWSWLLATVGVAGMAWSRTYLQVHWLSDVVAGALLGVGVSLVVFATAQILRPPRAAATELRALRAPDGAPAA